MTGENRSPDHFVLDPGQLQQPAENMRQELNNQEMELTWKIVSLWQK